MERLSPKEKPTHLLSKSWTERWPRFLKEHRSWWDCMTTDREHVHCLPLSVINELDCTVQPVDFRLREREPLLNDKQAAAERAFNNLCTEESRTVGATRAGHPIKYPYLEDSIANWRPNKNRNASTEDCGPEEFLDTALDEASNGLRMIEQSEMVHVAWLIQQPEYWQQLSPIKALHKLVEDHVSFEIISGRFTPLAALARLARAGEFDDMPPIKLLFEALAAFSTTWCISGFASWHLPVPHGPLMHFPPELLPLFRSRSDAYSAIPGFLPPSRLYGDKKEVWRLPPTVPRETRTRWQEQTKRDECLSNEVPTYSLILHVYVAEYGLQERFREGLPRGAMSRLVEGLSRSLNKDRDHIRRILRALKAALVGKR